MEENHPEKLRALHAIQEELETSRQVLKAIFDNIQSSIFLIAPDFKIMFFNKWAKDGSKLLYGRDLFVGDSILNYRTENDQAINKAFIEEFEQAIATKKQVVSEREMHFPDMRFWVRSEYTPVYNNNKLAGVLYNVQNISDRKRFQQQSLIQQEHLVEIAWWLSHETRQPVATMLGLINIIEKKTLDAENLKIINLLEDTAEKLEKIIQQAVARANKITPHN